MSDIPDETKMREAFSAAYAKLPGISKWRAAYPEYTDAVESLAYAAYRAGRLDQAAQRPQEKLRGND